MSMTVKEMNEAMEQIQEWKRIKEEAEDNITALNSKVMEFLNETEGCEAVDKKVSLFVDLSVMFSKLHFQSVSVRQSTKKR